MPIRPDTKKLSDEEIARREEERRKVRQERIKEAKKKHDASHYPSGRTRYKKKPS